jgi:hypothetical protein
VHTLTAATATTHHPTATVLLIALVWGVGYVIHCVIWPFRACRTCHGTGRSLAPSGRAWRPCRACKGNPARLRAGRRFYDHMRALKDRDH